MLEPVGGLAVIHAKEGALPRRALWLPVNLRQGVTGIERRASSVERSGGAMARAMNEEVPPVRTWLVKSEPTHYSIDALARDRSAGWEGVRNFQARNFMRDEMRQGELVLFAHSNADPSGIAGLAKVTGPVVPDPTQFDRRSEYFDAKSTRVAPRWHMVHLTFVERFAAVVSLEQLRREKGLAGMELLRKGSRLSVQPVERAHLALVLKLAHARTRLAP